LEGKSSELQYSARTFRTRGACAELAASADPALNTATAVSTTTATVL
jgi:hypothetical protein